MTKLFMLPKPVCINHLSLLENVLLEHDFIIENIYKVFDWKDISCKIYGPQLDSDKAFKEGFEAHTWLVNHLFGNRTIVLVVDEISENGLEEKLINLDVAKTDFRKRVYADETGGIIICMNNYKLPVSVSGKMGFLGVKQDNNFYKLLNLPGCWDFYYFKYVHCPDPNIKELEREWNILVNCKVICPENLITKEEWQCIKQLKTMIPLSDI